MRLQTNNYADRCGGDLSPLSFPEPKSEMRTVAGNRRKRKEEKQEVASVTLRYWNCNKPPPAT